MIYCMNNDRKSDKKNIYNIDYHRTKETEEKLNKKWMTFSVSEFKPWILKMYKSAGYLPLACL